MSKIYEALRQAEQDRANNGAAQPDNTIKQSAIAHALGDREQDLVIAPPPRSVATVMPIANGLVDKALATRTADLTGDLPAETAGSSIIDLSAVRHITWRPSLIQLPSLDDRGSAVEQFRSLRSRMQEFRDLNTLKSLLVSSGLPQEGKSFVTVNLAISFARHKAGRVLLIDGDMRRATLHKLLGTPQGPGLTEYLSGAASITEVMQRPNLDEPGRPLPSGLASLTFIPAGMEHEKAADLSGNRRFDKLIAAAIPYFDWIVVDSSPVNLVSDGVNLARACDAVLLVARGGVTKYEVAQRAVAELKASKVLGFVLNAIKNPPVAGGYYGYDGYDKIEE
jgi:protein-tyrosine kinase